MARRKHCRLPNNFWGRINHEVKEINRTENVVITEALRNFLKKKETENGMDKLGVIQMKLYRIKKKLEKVAVKNIVLFQAMQRKKNFMENQIS